MGLKEPFSGQTELVTGEIAEDLTYYFATSEQTPTAVALGVLMENEGGIVKCAGGLIVQLLPFAEEEVIAKLEDKISHMEPVTAMLNRGMTPEDICNELFGDMDLRINERVEAEFKCDCSKVEYIYISGLRHLLYIQYLAAKENVRLRLVNVDERTYKKLLDLNYIEGMEIIAR